ncbi:AAA family ATPase [Oceanobacillus sp. ISL-73]|uniref:ATP-dependent nuclease n=1 Tax=Oceanobacillus sp. ISL-73 TaxID=2819161 RepID=UPI001BEBD4FE|nr:AAA family ATPase [Oceanobacillus sp. ISL-73]MBT2652752.1 AAA family ATPase [Oceanobacillus sp. ISL-73]
MKLIKFSVINYKIFKKEFSIDFQENSISILTGRNNTGKSTILEAINCFFQDATKSFAIDTDCFSDANKEILLKATFNIQENENIVIKKKYIDDAKPVFLDETDKEINSRHLEKEKLDIILENKPFYITPSMSPESVSQLVQNIYNEVLQNDLLKLESPNENEDKRDEELMKEYSRIKDSYPKFLQKLKSNTDKILELVSRDVSNNLKTLFSNEHLSLRVIGGETDGFTHKDILKSINSSVNISDNKKPEMPLGNQGTGLQRMSLIFLIQNMIQNNLIGENQNKLLLIDEPEAFLHPEAVRALSRSLYKIGEQLPLMISTHSPVLIDLSERHTSIRVFRVGELEAIDLFRSSNIKFDDDDIKNMKIMNYVDSYVNEFFFADRILIVEGDTEYIAFKYLAEKENINLHVIRARGKTTIPTLMKVLNQFDSDYDVIHDIDNNPSFKPKELKKQLTNCKNIFDQKRKGVNIFGSIYNFEVAIGMEGINNKNKTKNIYEILHDHENNEFSKARSLLDNLFYNIINNTNLSLDGAFCKIESNSAYEELFLTLINEKESKYTTSQ